MYVPLKVVVLKDAKVVVYIFFHLSHCDLFVARLTTLISVTRVLAGNVKIVPRNNFDFEFNPL